MFCGTGSFKQYVDEDPAARGISGVSPKARRKHGGGKANPYAARGLDKFSTVLSELESRRDKILRRVGSDTGLVMVRFVQSNGGWDPIVVKLPDEQQLKDVASAKKPKASTAAAPAQPAASSSTPPDTASPREGAASARAKAPARRAAAFSWGRMRRPECYWLAVMVLTLVSLTVFGRVFAICCTSIWWYLVPTLSSGCSGGASELDARQAGLRRCMEKRRVASPLPPPPPQHAKKGSSCGVHEAVSSPRSHAKGKKG